MIWSILLLITLTSWVSGPVVKNVTQRSYQAEENQDITLEFPFIPRTDVSLKPINIVCEMYDGVRHVALLETNVGDKVSQPQDKRFQFELIKGQLRLNISRLRTNDSGDYECTVNTGGVQVSRKCLLNVTERDRPKPETPNTTSGGRDPSTTGSPPIAESPGLIVLYCAVGLMVVGALLGGYYCLRRKQQDPMVPALPIELVTMNP